LNNPVYGLAAQYGTEIDEAMLITAANVCDEDVPIKAGKVLKFDGSGDYIQTADVLDQIGDQPFTIEARIKADVIDGTGMQIGPHPFGQENLGTDYFALVMRGAEQSIMVMLVVGLLGVAIGTCIGAIAGFYGGWVDAILMRVTDLFLVTPTLIIGAVIGFRFGNAGVFPLAIMIGVFSWMGLARFVRTEFLSLREREFVDAARVAGASNRRIIFKHILPNAIGIIIVAGTLLLSGSILLESALSYLGFGVQSPDVSLGLLISHYQDTFTVSPWLFFWPGFFIITIALCINFIGDGLRDAFDPRQKRRITKKDREQAKAAVKAGV
jgi:peptide/nickel transport system permease protein